MEYVETFASLLQSYPKVTHGFSAEVDEAAMSSESSQGTGLSSFLMKTMETMAKLSSMPQSALLQHWQLRGAGRSLGGLSRILDSVGLSDVTSEPERISFGISFEEKESENWLIMLHLLMSWSGVMALLSWLQSIHAVSLQYFSIEQTGGVFQRGIFAGHHAPLLWSYQELALLLRPFRGATVEQNIVELHLPSCMTSHLSFTKSSIDAATRLSGDHASKDPSTATNSSVVDKVTDVLDATGQRFGTGSIVPAFQHGDLEDSAIVAAQHGLWVPEHDKQAAMRVKLIESLQVDKLNFLEFNIPWGSQGGCPVFSSVTESSKLRLKRLRLRRGQDKEHPKVFHIQMQNVDRKGGCKDATVSAIQPENTCNLETLELIGNGEEDVLGILLYLSETSISFNHLHNLRISSPGSRDRMPKAIATLMLSGNVPNLLELQVDNTPRGANWAVAINACFCDEKIKLAIINFNLQGSSVEERSVLQWVQQLEKGYLPHLQEFPIPHLLQSRTVQQAVLKAYKRNRYLAARLWTHDDKPEIHGEFLEKFHQLLRSNEISKKYLQELEKEPLEPGSKGKVFLCGSPGVGKTILRRTLQKTWKSYFTKSQSHKSTRGIEVENMQFSRCKLGSGDLELAIWDLAGQHEFEVLHSAFLPDLALGDGQAAFFVIVCSANATKESNVDTACESLLYWLRFISSNSRKVVEGGQRRRVFVVFNCFSGDRSGHDPATWETTLADCQRNFREVLNLHPQPFIFNAKHRGKTEPFKQHLRHEAQVALQQLQVHRICSEIMVNCQNWVAMRANQKYPVLSWSRYRALCWPGIEAATVKAATVHLHDTGRIILFKTLQSSRLTSEEYEITDQSVLVLDPQWLCEQVIGHILLPESLLRDGEKALMSTHQRPNGSIQLRLALVQREQFDVPEAQCEELVRILVRLPPP